MVLSRLCAAALLLPPSPALPEGRRWELRRQEAAAPPLLPAPNHPPPKPHTRQRQANLQHYPQDPKSPTQPSVWVSAQLKSWYLCPACLPACLPAHRPLAPSAAAAAAPAGPCSALQQRRCTPAHTHTTSSDAHSHNPTHHRHRHHHHHYKHHPAACLPTSLLALSAEKPGDDPELPHHTHILPPPSVYLWASLCQARSGRRFG